MHQLVKTVSEPPPIQLFSDSEVYDGKQPRHSKKGSKIPSELNQLIGNENHTQSKIKYDNYFQNQSNNNGENTGKSNILETFTTEPEQMPDAPSQKANSSEHYSPLYAPPTALRK